jgi:solute:Na+ symporter, SSS family
VIQTFVMFGGAFLCIGIVTVRMGGFGWVPTHWSPAWDVQPVFSLNPAVRVTLFGTLIHSIVWWVSTCGSDQLAIQRYLATRDAKAARRAFLYNSAAIVSVSAVLATLGFALLAFYTANPQYQIGQFNIDQEADYLFPHFVVNFAGYGSAGLVISGMLAAAMSSLSSGVTSTATVLNKDLIQNFMRRDLSETAKVRLGKWATAAIGAIVILLALLIGVVPGNLYEVTTKTNGLFVAPMFGLFVMAMYIPWATTTGTVLGSLYGIFVAFVVAFWDLTGAETLSFQWILVSSLIANLVTGSVLSLVPMKGKTRPYKIAMVTVMAMPLILAASWFISACYWKG